MITRIFFQFIFFPCLVICLSFFCFSQSWARSGDTEVPDWTLVFYLSSEAPNLAQDYQKLDEILAFLRTYPQPSLHLAILFDPPDPRDPVHLQVFHGGKQVRSEVLQKPVNLGSKETFAGFLLDSLTNASRDLLPEQKVLFPSQYTGLIITGDGSGWMPAKGTYEFNLLQKKNEEKVSRSQRLTSKFDSVFLTSVGYDFGSDTDSLTIPELTQSLAQVVKNIPKNVFDFIAFDACWMNAIEVLYELRHFAHYSIAEEGKLANHAFPYRTLLTSLHLSPRELVQEVVLRSLQVDQLSQTQLVGVDLKKTFTVASSFKKMLPLLQTWIQEVKPNENLAHQWRRTSAIQSHLTFQEDSFVNVDSLKWIEAVELSVKNQSAFHSFPTRFSPLLEALTELKINIQRSVLVTSFDPLNTILNHLRQNPKKLKKKEMLEWTRNLGVDFTEVPISPETFLSVVVDQAPIPRIPEIRSNLKVYGLLKSLKELYNKQNDLKINHGISLFYPDLSSPRLKIEAEENTLPYYERNLSFGQDSGWFNFLTNIYIRWKKWNLKSKVDWSQQDREAAVHDI